MVVTHSCHVIRCELRPIPIPLSCCLEMHNTGPDLTRLHIVSIYTLNLFSKSKCSVQLIVDISYEWYLVYEELIKITRSRGLSSASEKIEKYASL